MPDQSQFWYRSGSSLNILAYSDRSKPDLNSNWLKRIRLDSQCQIKIRPDIILAKT